MTMDIVKAGSAEEEEQVIKPQAVTPAVDTSTWPLLLKNYDKRAFGPSRHGPACWRYSERKQSCNKNAAG